MPAAELDGKIEGLLYQATTERRHYYVASVLRDVKAELARLREIEFRYLSCSK